MNDETHLGPYRGNCDGEDRANRRGNRAEQGRPVDSPVELGFCNLYGRPGFDFDSWIFLHVRIAVDSVVANGAFYKIRVVADNTSLPSRRQKLREGALSF